MIRVVRDHLGASHQSDGFNIGINIQPAAGETIPYVHIHLIPHYTGDVTNPGDSFRRVIPGKGRYR